MKPVKLLLVNTFLFPRGGDSTYTAALAELLRSRGHEVSFFGMKHPKNPPLPGEAHFVDTIDFVAANARKTPASAARVAWRSIYSLHARRRIAAALDAWRPDVAHLQNIHAHITPSILDELAARRIPVVWTLHDYKLVCPDSRLYSNGEVCEACSGGAFFECTRRRCKKGSLPASLLATLEAKAHARLRLPEKVARFIAPSRFLCDKFVELGWPRDRIVHVRNFLPASLLDRGVGPDRGYALYLGGLEGWKGVHTLLRAWSEVAGMPLKVAGQGSQRAEVEVLLAASGAQVELLGHLHGERLRGLVDGASFVCVPSEWYENCPYAVLEAMAAGKPVLASRLGGLPELVRDGRTGLLFEAGNAGDLARKATLLAREPRLRGRMAREAREEAVRRFGPDRHYASLMRIYSGETPRSLVAAREAAG